MQNLFLFISGGEIIFILLAVVLLFGAKRLPEIARTLGKGLKQFKDAANDIKKEMTELAQDEKVVFLGEGIINAGRVYGTLDGVPWDQCIEILYNHLS